MTLSPKHEWPAEIWEDGTRFWHVAIEKDIPTSPRINTAFHSQLRYRLAMPILSHQIPLGILEFFTTHLQNPDPDMLLALESIATHIGQFIHRETAEIQAHASMRELQSSNAALMIAHDKALASAKAKANFLAAMSHEIRTPLNGVIGPTELLLDESLSEDHRDLLNTILLCSRSLLQTINDILDFSKLDAGKLPLEMIPFDPRTLLDEVLDMFAHQARDKRLEFSGCTLATVPALLKGDPGRVRQILINLVGNAIKFTSAGDVHLSCSTTALNPHNTILSIEIHDTGIGISPENIKQLFTPFHQADAGMARKFGGTGLGLAISKELAELMHGEISVESILGQGSRFLVSIPFQIVESPSPISIPPFLNSRRVCVVDAHPTTAQVLGEYLEFLGLSWTRAENETEALTLLQQTPNKDQPWDLVILVEPLGGLEVGEVHRLLDTLHQSAKTPLVVINHSKISKDILTLQEDRVAICLTQPIRFQPLRNAITASLSSENFSGESTTMAAPHLVSPPEKDEVPRHSHERILVAEDNLVNQKVTIRMLQNLGYQVDVVVNGQEAVAAMNHGLYDLILMDCQMPEMDGLEATKKIREAEKLKSQELRVRSEDLESKISDTPDSLLLTPHCSRIPIIALTANALPGNRESCLNAGMDDFLSKPVGIAELRMMLTKWLAQPTPLIDEDQHLLARQQTPDTLPPSLDDSILENLKSLGGEDDPEFFLSVVGQFLEDLPRHELGIHQAIEGKNADALVKAAHACKGSARSIGAISLADISYVLEQLGREGTIGGAPETFKQWLAEKDRTVSALQPERDKLSQEVSSEK